MRARRDSRGGRCARFHSLRVGSSPRARAFATHSRWACRRREASPSGTTSACSVMARRRLPHSGQVYVAGFRFVARRSSHQSATASSRTGRRAAYVDAVAGGLEPGWGVDDGAGLCFGGTELVEAVSARPESRAYRVERRDGTGAVTAIPVRRLWAPDSGVKAPPPDVAELRELRAARRGGRLRA